MALANKGDFKYGMWTAFGVLAALAIWNIIQGKFPALNTGLK